MTEEKWEIIKPGSTGAERLKIKGGWLVAYHAYSSANGTAVGVCFIPDINHEFDPAAPLEDGK